jgi:TRAP transporter TAXI family solute receptor
MKGGRKMSKRKSWIIVAFCMVLLFSLGWFHSPGRAEIKFMLKIGTGPVGGYWFPGGAVLSSIITDKVEGARGSPTLGGGVSNCRDIDSGKMDIAYTYNGTAGDAWESRPPFKKKLTNVRFLANMYITPFTIVALKETGIKTFEDLKGKRFSPGKKGYTGKITFDRMLKEYGMSYDDLGKVTLVGYSDGALLMKDKHIDFYAMITMTPSAPFLDVATFFPLTLVNYKPEILDRMCEKYDMVKVTVPAKDYPGQDEENPTVGFGACFIIRKDLPEDLVYGITKSMWGEFKRFHQIQPKLKDHVLIKNALLGITVPLHRGAYKYYKEVGLEIPKKGMPVD